MYIYITPSNLHATFEGEFIRKTHKDNQYKHGVNGLFSFCNSIVRRIFIGLIYNIIIQFGESETTAFVIFL